MRSVLMHYNNMYIHTRSEVVLPDLFGFCLQLYSHVTPLELLSILIAALCHDLDHPGKKAVIKHSNYGHVPVVELV